jgi:hypothetical protein
VSAVERFIERVKAERVARGQAPTIESLSVYRLLDAVVVANAAKRGVPPARWSTKEDAPRAR